MIRFQLLSISILILSLSTLSYAQVSQPARFEMEQKFSDGYFTIIPMKENGLFLIRDKDRFDEGKKVWEVVALDSALKEIKTFTIHVEPRNRLIGYEHDGRKLFLLYRQGETDKSSYELVETNLDHDSQPRYIIKPELAVNTTHFSKVGTSIVLGGYVNKEPAFFVYDMVNDNIKLLPGFFQKDTEIVDMRVNENKKTFNVVLIERGVRNERSLVFQTYDETGKMLLEDKVPIEEKRTLQTGITSTLKREDVMVLGAWGEGNSRQSNGFYAIPVDPFGEQQVRYVAFGELDHYLDYQKPKRAERIKAKTQEEINIGSIPNFVNYVMPYRVKEYSDGFILLAEAYNPSSSYNQFASGYNPYYYGSFYSPYGWYYPGYGRYYPRPYYPGNNNARNVTEIKTYQSVLVSFSPTGDVQWDISFELDDIKQSSLEQIADFHLSGDKAYLLYKDESELKVKQHNLATDESESSTIKVELRDPLDEIRSEKELEGGIRYWYGDAFYVWGFQTIRNNTLKEKTRDVFYINKVMVK